MKSILFLFFVFLITGCFSRKIENSKYCIGTAIELSKALKKPDRYKNIFVLNYKDSVFPSADIVKLTNLKCLKIHGTSMISQKNDFKVIPSKINIDTFNIRQIDKLTYLDLAWLDFRNFPNDLFKLKNIEYLSINGSLIDTIPIGISDLKNLEILSLRLNNLNYLPEWFKQVKSLKALDLGNNAFTHIPSILYDLEHLQVISFANPEGYEGVGIQPFRFSHNKIDYLKEIGSLTKLLNLQNIQRIYIDVPTDAYKSELFKKINDKKINQKLKITVAL